MSCHAMSLAQTLAIDWLYSHWPVLESCTRATSSVTSRLTWRIYVLTLMSSHQDYISNPMGLRLSALLVDTNHGRV